LNANTWQNKYMAEAYPSRAGEFEKPNDRQYIVGASAGGPIFKDKTFYFGLTRTTGSHASCSRLQHDGAHAGLPQRRPQRAPRQEHPSRIRRRRNPIYKGAIVDR